MINISTGIGRAIAVAIWLITAAILNNKDPQTFYINDDVDVPDYAKSRNNQPLSGIIG